MQGYVIPGIIIVAAALFVYTINNLSSMKEVVDGTWADTAALIRERVNLIPDLEAMVEGCLETELGTLKNAAATFTTGPGGPAVGESAEVDQSVARALEKLFTASENYPVLKDSPDFQKLQQEFSRLENDIAFAGKRYNRTVKIYNSALGRFPNNLLAGPLKFIPRGLFPVTGNQDLGRANNPGGSLPGPEEAGEL